MKKLLLDYRNYLHIIFGIVFGVVSMHFVSLLLLWLESNISVIDELKGFYLEGGWSLIPMFLASFAYGIIPGITVEYSQQRIFGSNFSWSDVWFTAFGVGISIPTFFILESFNPTFFSYVILNTIGIYCVITYRRFRAKKNALNTLKKSRKRLDSIIADDLSDMLYEKKGLNTFRNIVDVVGISSVVVFFSSFIVLIWFGWQNAVNTIATSLVMYLLAMCFKFLLEKITIDAYIEQQKKDIQTENDLTEQLRKQNEIIKNRVAEMNVNDAKEVK